MPARTVRFSAILHGLRRLTPSTEKAEAVQMVFRLQRGEVTASPRPPEPCRNVPLTKAPSSSVPFWLCSGCSDDLHWMVRLRQTIVGMHSSSVIPQPCTGSRVSFLSEDLLAELVNSYLQLLSVQGDAQLAAGMGFRNDTFSTATVSFPAPSVLI